MIYKNRNRITRGVLGRFEDLPQIHQNNFCLIKKTVQEFFDENVYVYGSFYWGYWDNKSDYDVCIKYRKVKNPKDELLIPFSMIKSLLKNEHNLDVDIIMIREDLGILIP
jgi:predicted nucleotidyltransferase